MKPDRASAVLAIHFGLIALLLGLQFVVPPFHHGMLTRIMVLSVYATGYNVLLGYTGFMSLGHAMFFAAGTYATGLTIYHLGFGAVAGFLAGVLASIIAALGIGLITLLTDGAAFLIVTMMFGQAFHLATLYFNNITMGDQGFVVSASLTVELGGVRLTLADPM